ncbi:MAG: hypothetical protein Q8873_07140 [Bacillota bacterium]|nr:hypothetical protein [Bacillota bacterium]
MELNENSKKVLKSNIEILFNQLKVAVDSYVKNGRSMGDFSFINAYLSATLNAMVSYIDRLVKVTQLEESELVEALKFANNLQKHKPELIQIAKSTGGMAFPICFENEVIISEISVVWDDCICLKTRKDAQKISYEKNFQQQPIIETLTPIVDKLLQNSCILSI